MKFLKTNLRGIGQVMLQENAWTGLLFLIGIFYNSWVFGLGAILGVMTGTLSAYLFKYSKEDIEKGLYGFNGVLVGISIFYFFDFSLATIVLVILGSVLSVLLFNFINKKIPAFTFPFFVSVWIIILLFNFFKLPIVINSSLMASDSFNLFQSLSLGFGQVMFQESIFTGILFFIGISINSKKDALYALYGSLFGAIVAMIFSLPISMINIGLFGFNGILCGIALRREEKNSLLKTMIAIILSVILIVVFDKLGIIYLTAPFVISTWIILLVYKFYEK